MKKEMTNRLTHIKLNSNEETKDNSFYSLITSGTSVICLDDEEYLVDAKAITKLGEENIGFDKIEEESCDTGIAQNVPEA